MIEITAKLSRGSVYFTGEQIKCYVTFRNVIQAHDDHNNDDGDASVPSTARSADQTAATLTADAPAVADGASSGSNGASDEPETLAWAGVQIYCHCTLDESKAQFIADEGQQRRSSSSYQLLSSTDTSFMPSRSERGHVVFQTQPRILFCDLKLGPNESRTFSYQEQIPVIAPPSYYGSAAKYLYKLTIGTQRVKGVIQLLKMPLRILSVGTDEAMAAMTPTPATNNGPAINGSLTGKLGGLTLTTGDDSKTNLDLVLHRIECLTARRSPSSYLISNQAGHVARFYLLKSTFKLGEDVVGIFNFTESNIPCVQFTVSLQSEEVISDECRINSNRLGNIVTTYSKCHEFCLDMSNTQIILPIPLTITPAFSTNIVSLSWKLHFEFVTTRPEEIVEGELTDSQGIMHRAPNEINVQTMVWDLPLNIYPAHPIAVARGLQLPASSTLAV